MLTQRIVTWWPAAGEIITWWSKVFTHCPPYATMLWFLKVEYISFRFEPVVLPLSNSLHFFQSWKLPGLRKIKFKWETWRGAGIVLLCLIFKMNVNLSIQVKLIVDNRNSLSHSTPTTGWTKECKICHFGSLISVQQDNTES